MSSLTDLEFVQALNPLYAFPIVAVILCVLIVYAFGFKSPVQPPSFDGIEEEKKTSRKRKTKEYNKGKVVQNGKMNGTASNKAQNLLSAKKRETEKSTSADKPVIKKSVVEKKVTKKTKLPNDKVVQEKKLEILPIISEDFGEDGWVQLVSKKGRKIRRNNEILLAAESRTKVAVIKPLKSSHVEKSVENTLPEDVPEILDVTNKPSPEIQLSNLNDKNDAEVARADDKKNDVVIVEEDSTLDVGSLEKVPLKNVKSEKLNEETSNKSKKKKKKSAEILNADSDCIKPSESPAKQEIPVIPTSETATNNASVISENPESITGKVQEAEPKESKSSNVVFDELEGLYPKVKEQKKKKKVRRDH